MGMAMIRGALQAWKTSHSGGPMLFIGMFLVTTSVQRWGGPPRSLNVKLCALTIWKAWPKDNRTWIKIKRE